MGVRGGIDLVSVARIEGMLARWGSRFLARIYTDGEIAYCSSRPCPARSFAARFAAKEAFFKAVSPRPGSAIGHRNIEVIVDDAGAPAIRPHGRARLALGDRDAALSLSHEQDYAVALVVTSPGVGGAAKGARRSRREVLP
jgi:holo-[acyl-carrier protein] synthase